MKSVVPLIFWLLVAPVWSDVAVPLEAQRQEVKRETKGLTPGRQHAKVEQMLREMPQRVADQEKKYFEAEAAERAGQRGGEPAWMIGDYINYLGKQELFWHEWLTTHSDPPPVLRYLAILFVLAGILWGARRAVRSRT